ncbi:MAG: Fe-S oxidoreductase, partial [Actinotalea sp.]|nr:Fe-S oxidoreductase [Actinotalea sp.]
MDGLQILALVIAVVATVVGVTVFVLGVRAIVRTVGRGGPAPDRTTQPGRRTWLVVKEVLGHGRFQHRPMVRVAHWVVMVSFPVLFLTLITGYGQIVEPTFALPLIGHWPPFAWLVEVFAWLGLLGIVALALVRQREHPRRGTQAGTRVSGARREQDLPAADDAAGPGGPEGPRASRFFGSNWAQAYFVEAIIGAVVVCVLLLRGLEYALAVRGPATEGSAPLVLVDTAALWWEFPLTAWFGQWFTGVPTPTLELAVVVVALLKILTSMLWMVVVGMRPAMGVSWHRFLAVVNVWARRETDGRP